jgi:hypothetical protein
VAGGLASGGLLLVTTTSASAHFTCNDGSTTEIDDAAVACTGHGGIAHEGVGGPTTEAPDHDHDASEAPATTRAKATPTTRKATATPSTLKASPRYTG